MECYRKPINIFKQSKLSLEEYAIYKRDMREYHLKNNIPIRGIRIRKMIYPVVSFGVKLFRLGNKHTLEVIDDKRIASSKPCIFAVTHVGVYDIERVFEACKTSCWVFNGDPETVYRNFDGLGLSISGVILVDTDSKSDRKVALETAIKLLNAGGNLMFFPEGIWNVDVETPVLHLFPGVIEIAFRTGADVVPIAIEQYDQHFQVNIGKNISVEELCNISKKHENISIIKRNALIYLRDIMATLKWEIFELHKETRENLKDVNSIQTSRVNDKLYEWTDSNGQPFYSINILDSKKYKPKDQVSKEIAFAHFMEIIPTMKNAFLFNKRLK